MFGFGSGSAAVGERAGKVRVLVAMIAANLYSKSADEFVKFYEATTAVERDGPDIYFGVKLSPSSWYDMKAHYPEANPPRMDDLLGARDVADEMPRSLAVFGGGDDYGVFISVHGIDAGRRLTFTSRPDDAPGRMQRP